MKFKDKVYYFLKYIIARPIRLINFVIRKYPHTIMIEPVSFCNLKCPLCPTPHLKREKGLMNFGDYKNIIDEVNEYIFHLRLWGWGEPLLHPEIFEMIKYAKSKKMYVNLSTNASFLNKEKVKKIIDSKIDNFIVSLDGITSNVYEKYRKRGNFTNILESIRFLSKYKKEKNSRTKITIQFIVMKHNEHQIKDFINLIKSYGLDFQIKTVGAMVPENINKIKKFLPKNPRYNRYVEGKEKPQKPMCLREAFILQNGNVSACCNDAYGEYIFGNIKTQNLKEIWKNKRYRNFREMAQKRKVNNPMCNLCLNTKKTHAIKIK